MSNPKHPLRPQPKRSSPSREAAPAASPSGDDAAWVVVGTIVAPFGLHGEVKLLPQTDFPERIAQHSVLFLGPDRRKMTVESSRMHGSFVLVRFAGIADMTAAETLRGLVVAIPQAEAAPLSQDQYYIHDLVGLAALDLAGATLGTVIDVIVSPAQDLLVVHRSSEPDVLVPLVKAIVRQVDLAAHQIVLDPPAGLFDDDFIQG